MTMTKLDRIKHSAICHVGWRTSSWRHHKLELSGSSAIYRGRGPSVIPHDVLETSLADHRLDREDVAHLHLAGIPVFVVQNIRIGVEDLTDTVTAELAYTGVAVGLDKILDNRANAVERLPWPTIINRCLPAIVGNLHKLLASLVNLTDQKGLRAVTMVAPVVASYVDVNDIAVLKDARVGDTVADDLVYGSAAGLREPMVVEGARIRATLDRLVGYERIDCVGRHAR